MIDAKGIRSGAPEDECRDCSHEVMREMQRCKHPKRLLQGIFESPCNTKQEKCPHYDLISLEAMVKRVSKTA